MIKAVILDFYGVVQTDQVIVWTEKQTAEHPNIRSAVDVASTKLDLNEITLDEYHQELAAAVSRPVSVVEHELENEISINHPLLEVVDQLREEGIKTAVLSNDGSSLRAYMEGHGITRYFDEIFISGELNMMKPDARIYEYAVQQLGFEPQKVIFFDDRQANVDGALRAGLQSELYTSVSQVRKQLS